MGGSIFTSHVQYVDTTIWFVLMAELHMTVYILTNTQFLI